MEGNGKKLNIVLIFSGGDGFPDKGAYTNRVLAFAKGFVKNNCSVSLLIIYPGRSNLGGIQGEMDGFHYVFCAGLTRPNGWIKKKYIGLKGIYYSLKVMIGLQRKEPIDAVLTFSQEFLQNFPLYLFTRLNKAVFIREDNEFPIKVIRKGHNHLTFYEKVFFKFANRFYDGFILISNAQAAFIKKLLRKYKPLEIVPIVVDKDRFEFQNVKKKKQITFCGNLFAEKDGVRVLLKAFSKIHFNHPEYQLILIGDISASNEFKVLQNLVKDYGIEAKVKFTAFVCRDKIPKLLTQSSVLVLARPDNIQTKGGFPTKMGEYLATGRPVLLTSVSDIPLYIKDGVNGYLVDPDDVGGFAKKLDWILFNYNRAEAVGIEGQKLTDKEFNNIYQSRRIIEFIDKIKKIKKGNLSAFV